MGEMKHTPGPWQLGGGNVDWAVEPDDANVGCWSSQPVGPMGRIDPVCMVIQRDDEGYRSGDDELDANAHLIAASPDLLKALRDLLEACEADCGAPEPGDEDNEAVGAGEDGPMTLTFGMLRRARAALSKAEGRSLSSASGQEADHG